jgi:hypothetical protein
MSFNEIDRQLLNGAYTSFADFGADVEQVFANCYRFNSEDLPIYQDAAALQLAYREAVADDGATRSPSNSKSSAKAPESTDVPAPACQHRRASTSTYSAATCPKPSTAGEQTSNREDEDEDEATVPTIGQRIRVWWPTMQRWCAVGSMCHFQNSFDSLLKRS